MTTKRGKLYARDANGELYQILPEGPYGEYRGAAVNADGESGFVPPAAASAWNKFLRGDGQWVAIEGGSGGGGGGSSEAIPIYAGPTASAHGVTGTVPVAAYADRMMFLRGDATWAEPIPPVYQGATASSSGVSGAVPAASSEERAMFLRGDGEWAPVAAGSGGGGEGFREVSVTDILPTDLTFQNLENESIVVYLTDTSSSEYHGTLYVKDTGGNPVPFLPEVIGNAAIEALS